MQYVSLSGEPHNALHSPSYMYMYVKMHSCVSCMLLDTNPTHYPIYRYIKFTIIDMQNFNIAQHYYTIILQ